LPRSPLAAAPSPPITAGRTTQPAIQQVSAAAVDQRLVARAARGRPAVADSATLAERLARSARVRLAPWVVSAERTAGAGPGTWPMRVPWAPRGPEGALVFRARGARFWS